MSEGESVDDWTLRVLINMQVLLGKYMVFAIIVKIHVFTTIAI